MLSIWTHNSFWNNSLSQKQSIRVLNKLSSVTVENRPGQAQPQIVYKWWSFLGEAFYFSAEIKLKIEKNQIQDNEYILESDIDGWWTGP